MPRQIELRERHVRAIAADAKQLVPILEATFSPRIEAAAYEPTGLLFIAGEVSRIEQAERLVEAWGKR